MVNFNPRDISLFVAQGCWERLHHFESLKESNPHIPEQYVAIIKEYLNKYKTKNFEFIDYCNADLEGLNAFCSLIIRNKLKFKWSAPAIMNPKMDYAIINNMAQTGCKKLIFDLFSLPHSLLKEIKIMFEPESASRVLSLCRQEGISVGINLFFGHPQETREDFENTIGFLKSNIDFINEITRVTYCPSSYIYTGFLEASLCRYWPQCLSLNKKDVAEFSKIQFPDCISKILNLGKPIIKIEPNEIIFNDLLNYCIDQSALPPHSIGKGRIEIAYSEGGLQFFWNNIRITANVGLNIAIHTRESWVDSTNGNWQILERENGYFKVEVSFRTLPISLIWQIKIIGDYKIFWKLDMEIEKRLRIDEIRMVCLVDHRYPRWFNDYRQAAFPPLDNQWHDLCQEELPIFRVGLRPTAEVALPLFAMETKNKNIFPLVQNTPLHTRARIIGFRHKAPGERKGYSPGHYVFEGEMALSKLV